MEPLFVWGFPAFLVQAFTAPGASCPPNCPPRKRSISAVVTANALKFRDAEGRGAK